MTEIRALRDGIGRDEVTAYLPGQAPGALPNGAAIVKARMEPGDGTPVGVTGVVLASHAVTERMVSEMREAGKLPDTVPRFFYFVEWDNRPGLAVAISDWKIALREQP
jgi:hypothetical protein